MKRAVTYARVSYYDPEGENLESQLEMCREYAEKHGYLVVDELTEDDRGAPGASLDLPALNQVIEMTNAGQIDVIVTREMDRFARGLAKQFIKEFEFESAGMKVEYVLDKYDDTPEGQLTKNVRAIIAEYERGKTLERTTHGRLRSIESGNVYTGGWSPFGYRLAEVDGKRTLVIHEEEAGWVRQIFDWYVNGDGEKASLSLRAIAHKLSALGVLTGADKGNAPARKKHRAGRWGMAAVRYILRNMVYIGQWTYKTKDGKMFTVAIEPIIDQSTFDAAQRRLSQNKRMTSRNTKHKYLLRGRIYCACGYLMTGTCKHWVSRKGRKKTFYYHCGGYHWEAVRRCWAKRIRTDRVEPLVWNAIVEAVSDPDKLRECWQRYQNNLEQRDAPVRRRIEQIDEVVEDQKARLARLLDLFLDGHHTRNVLQSRQEEIEARIVELDRERIKLLNQINNQPAEQFDSLVAFSAEIRDALNLITDDFDRQRWVIDRLDVRVTVEPVSDLRKITVESCGYPLAVLYCD